MLYISALTLAHTVQVNVFELGHTYLNLVRTLNLRLPPIDPSHHISRFAALLEFGTSPPQVAVDAARLVARMDRDWLAGAAAVGDLRRGAADRGADEQLPAERAGGRAGRQDRGLHGARAEAR